YCRLCYCPSCFCRSAISSARFCFCSATLFTIHQHKEDTNAHHQNQQVQPNQRSAIEQSNLTTSGHTPLHIYKMGFLDFYLTSSTYPCYWYVWNKHFAPPAPPSMTSEYEEVIRIDISQDAGGIDAKPGHMFVSEGQPLSIRQYCREMTLARGRLLYEIWDSWNRRLLGYIVPTSVHNDALVTRPTAALSPWLDEPHQKRRLLTHYHDTLLAQFPRMPRHSAKTISEKYFSTSRHRFSALALENCVIEHVKTFWTSYTFRVNEVRQGRREVEALIKPRMREVLKSWLPFPQEMPLTGKDEVRELFERHALLDDYEEDGGFVERQSPVKVKVQDWDGVLRWNALRHCGGLEGLGNSYSAVISSL
ncbi:hypothetical protein EJ03DRAFT_129808, partial [Teratosphaeria nubilosa]